MNAADKTFARRYFEVQKVLDDELGTEDTDGAGEGIVADVLLALDKRERRGAVKALRAEAARGRDAAGAFSDPDPDRRHDGFRLLMRTADAIDAQADAIESGMVTL